MIKETSLEEVILFPRGAFAPASVAAAAYIGEIGTRTRSCVVKYWRNPEGSFERRLGADALGGSQSWWPLLFNNRPTSRASLPLGRLADVLLGVQLYGLGKGRPPQTRRTLARRPFTSSRCRPGFRPAVQGRDVGPFRVGVPRRFVKQGRWLVYPGRHAALSGRPRVFVRELCRRDGKVTAAVANEKLLPLHGVHAVLPQAVGGDVLAAILNSTVVAEHVRTHSGSFAKADFQRITLGELRELPIPTTAIARPWRHRLGLPELSREDERLQRKLKVLARSLRRRPREAWETLVDALVSKLYGCGGPSQ